MIKRPITIKLEYRENGSPKLSWNNNESEPVGYQGIAQLDIAGQRFIAVSEYYAGSPIPPNKVIELIISEPYKE